MLKTTELIDGFEIEITWEFMDIEDRHDCNFCEWSVVGEDEQGNRYQGTAFADADNPEDDCDEVVDVEQI